MAAPLCRTEYIQDMGILCLEGISGKGHACAPSMWLVSGHRQKIVDERYMDKAC